MEERRAHLQELLAQYKRNLQQLELQKARYGIDVPLHVINGLEYTRAEIKRLEEDLFALEEPKQPKGIVVPLDALTLEAEALDMDVSGSAVAVGPVNSRSGDIPQFRSVPSPTELGDEFLLQLGKIGTAIADLTGKVEHIRMGRVGASVFSEVEFEPEENMCFVLMPFGDDVLQEVYEIHIKPMVEQSGLRCQRADDVLGPTPIMEDIWQGINGARVVLAELTGQNPNVFYELGLCHAIGKDAILIAQDIKWVPFDVRHRRAIIYTPTPRGLKQLEDLLAQTLEAVVGKSPAE